MSLIHDRKQSQDQLCTFCKKGLHDECTRKQWALSCCCGGEPSRQGSIFIVEGKDRIPEITPLVGIPYRRSLTRTLSEIIEEEKIEEIAKKYRGKKPQEYSDALWKRLALKKKMEMNRGSLFENIGRVSKKHLD